MLMKLEPSTLNEQNNEFENTELPSSKKQKKFDLWAYHTSKATTQIEDRTAPIYQEVYYISFYIVLHCYLTI